MFDLTLIGADSLFNLKKNLQKNVNEYNQVSANKIIVFFRRELNKLNRETTHTILINTLKVKTTKNILTKKSGIHLTISYTVQDLEAELEEQKEEYKKLITEQKELEKKIKELSNRLASSRKQNVTNKRVLSQLQASYDRLAKQRGRTDKYVKSFHRRITTLTQKVQSESFNLQNYQDKIVSLQEDMQVTEKHIVESKPIPIKSANQKGIYTRKLDLNTILKSQEIPDHVRSQYLVRYIADNFVEDEYMDGMLEVICKSF